MLEKLYKATDIEHTINKTMQLKILNFNQAYTSKWTILESLLNLKSLYPVDGAISILPTTGPK